MFTAKYWIIGNYLFGLPRKGKRRKDRDRDGRERDIDCRKRRNIDRES